MNLFQPPFSFPWRLTLTKVLWVGKSLWLSEIWGCHLQAKGMSIWGQGGHFKSQKLPSKKVSKFLLGRNYKGAVSTGQTRQQAYSSVDWFVDTTLKPLPNCLQLQVPIHISRLSCNQCPWLYPQPHSASSPSRCQEDWELHTEIYWSCCAQVLGSYCHLLELPCSCWGRLTWQWLWLTSPILCGTTEPSKLTWLSILWI